jgi:hypothetical protein
MAAPTPCWTTGRPPRYDLGLTEDEVWSLSPDHIRALQARREADDERRDRRAGTVAALLYNINRPRHAQPLAWDDFFPTIRTFREQESGPDVGGWDKWAAVQNARAARNGSGPNPQSDQR